MSDEWTSKSSFWNSNSPDTLAKGRLKQEKPDYGFKSYFDDPFAPMSAMGYQQRPYLVPFETLKKIPQQLSIVAAIIQTRINQIASFSNPYRNTKSIGYEIKHKNPGRLTTKGEREFILELEKYVFNCGQPNPNPYAEVPRDGFDHFLKKIVRDTLMYDQVCFEVVPDRRGLPYEFMAIDSSSIRIAAPNTLDMYKYAGGDTINKEMFETMRVADQSENNKINYVQLVHGQIRNLYSRSELAFGVRNPRTDMRVYGYGYSELEQLIRTITAAIFAEEYNIRNFSQGSSPKGILSFKGDAMDNDMLEDFKRKWNQNVEGVHNAWRTPILQTEGGIEWTDLHPTNQEMEYGKWLEYLIKIICGVFLIDPAEVNFDMAGGVQQTPLFESSNEWKLKASRDRGLKPLLKFIGKMVNDNVVQKLDDNFVFDFVGLDELTEQEKHELRKEQVASYMTLNEIRRAEDLPDIADGDRVLNPTYLQAVQIQQQADQQEEQMAMQGDAAGQEGGQEAAAEEEAPAEEDPSPPYVENFTKSQRTFEISDLDDWFDEDAGV